MMEVKMKSLMLFLFIFFAITIMAQEKNMTITDERSGNPMLIGYCTQEAFSLDSFSDWFTTEYNEYEVDTETVDLISSKMDDVKITIVLATWCSDTRRELPRFLKILDALKMDYANVTMIAVDREKEAEGTNVSELEVNAVPTFIFYKNENELGRIIEFPMDTLEKDMLEFLE